MKSPSLVQPTEGLLVADRYEISRVLARRQGAVVVRAKQRSLQREVALKLVPKAHDAVIAARFSREAEALGRLNHPACVDVFDHGTWEGWLYLAVAWVEGTVLSDRMGEPWDPVDAVAVVLDLARGLEHAHARGVVHRDVQPARIVLPVDGDLKVRASLVDFGLARIERSDFDTTAGRAPMGTPGYIAPERLEGAKGDPAGDVYGLGIVLYEMLCGEHPLAGLRSVDVLAAQSQGAIPPLSERMPPGKSTPALLWAVDLATRADPAERLQDGSALTKALLAARASLLDPAVQGLCPELVGEAIVLPPALEAASREDTATLLVRRDAARRRLPLGWVALGVLLLLSAGLFASALLLVMVLWALL
ncbi:MAG: serine/threonine protein kinase [Deltaproteobacteria bacterium]|nr:MAG: serine/threonine protein kinase [Deltaproteobacteria bacterium]